MRLSHVVRSRQWLIAVLGLTLVSAGLLALPSGAATTQIDVKASGDAYVASKFGNRNFGSANFIRASSGNNLRKSYVKFNVPATSGTLSKAYLFMKAKTANASYSVSKTGDFNESTVTFKNAPEVGNTITTAKSSTNGNIGADVTSAITIGAARTVNFAITSPYGLALDFASRESKTPPSLVIITENGSSTSTSKAQSTTSTTKAATPLTTTTAPTTSSTLKTPSSVTVPNTVPNSGAMPTRANTGPRYALTGGDMTPAQFFASKNCNRQRITGTLNFYDASTKGQTYNLTDCEITGGIDIYLEHAGKQLALADMPTVNMNYVDILGSAYVKNAWKWTFNNSYLGGKFQLSLEDQWQFQTGPAPISWTNSMVWQAYVTKPSHMETFQTGDFATGMTFTNVAFVQQGGPLENSGITAVVNVAAKDTVFDGCWFLFEGQIPTYYNIYINGPGVVVKNSHFTMGGNMSYPYTAPLLNATYSNNYTMSGEKLSDKPWPQW